MELVQLERISGAGVGGVDLQKRSYDGLFLAFGKDLIQIGRAHV